ncbi:MAG: 50S ribosomal protein L18 [Gammaproteobacteria bacterium]
MTSDKSRRSRRLARAAQTRKRQRRLGATRLLVHTTGKHTYAQIIAADDKVLASASTAEKEMRARLGGSGGNVAAAMAIGERLAQKAQKLDASALVKLAFDRGGRKYHGRVRTLAEAARAGGLQF